MQPQITWITNIRVWASLAVVVLHVSAVFLSTYGIKPGNTENWITGNAFNSFVRWCVPLFIMVSGYLNLSKPSIDTLSFFKKKALRILIPLIAWTLIFLLFKLSISVWIKEEQFDFALFFKRFLMANHTLHLYFLFLIFGLYWITPVLHSWIEKSSKKEVRTYMIGFFFIGTLPLALFHFLPESLNPGKGLIISKNAFSYFINFIGYYLSGYYMIKHVDREKYFKLAIVLFLLAVATTFLLTHITETYEYYYEYNSINVIVMSLSLFYIFSHLKLKKEQQFKLIADCSLGIFLLHPIVMQLFPNFREIALSTPAVIAIPLLSLAVYFISFVIIFVMRKLPILKQIV